MGKNKRKGPTLTGTKYGDQVSELLGFYQAEVKKLEESKSYFMAAVALGAALETALLGYMLVEWGPPDNGEELEIPSQVTLEDLIQAAKHFDLLDAVHFRDTETSTSKSVEQVIHEIQHLRNHLHPAKALKNSFDPAKFNAVQYERLHNIYTAVIDNLMHNL